MEEGQDMKVTINATEIIKKLKSKKDRENFCHEMNWYAPNEPGYDTNFFFESHHRRKKISSN